MFKLSCPPLLVLPVLLALLLPSCDQKAKEEADKARRDLSESKAELAELQRKVDQMEVEKLEVEKLKAKAAGKASGEEESPMYKAVLEDLRKVQEENKDLKKDLEDLREENEGLRQQVNAKIRNKAIGEEMAELQTRSGKTYRQVKIKAIDDYGVSIVHEAGTTTLRLDTAPAEWVDRFALIEEPQFEEPERPVVSAAPEMQVEKAPVASPAPAPALASGENKAAAGEGEEPGDGIIRAKFGGIFTIEGKKSSGTGFLAISEGQVFLYTAAHVLSGDEDFVIKNASGERLGSLGTCQVAVDCDLARIQVDARPELALNISPPAGVQVESPIRAIGNSGGSGVLTLLKGAITGVGLTELETSANVIQGNSGGPILSAETGDVLAVVARAEAGRDDVWAAGTEFAEVRRFASRIDRPIQWKKIALESLQAEEQKLAAFNGRTRLMFALASLEPGQNGMRLDMRMAGGKGPTILAIFTEHRNIPAVRKLMEMNRSLAGKQLRTSEKDLLKLFVRYYSDLIGLFARDTAKFDPASFSYPYRKPAEQSKKWREEATTLLRATANAMNEAR